MNRKNYSDLEPRIKDALQSQADRLDRLYESDPARGEAFLRRVSRRIDATQSTRGEKIMNHRFRNVLVAAGAMCILGSAAVMASGGFVHWISGSSARDEISSYEALAAMGEQHGVPFTINAPETFGNGYTFASARPVTAAGVDAEGNETPLPTEVSLTYEKENLPDVNIYESQSRPDSTPAPQAQPRQIGEYTFYFSEDHYKFVPPDYEITEEEQRAVDAGTLYVSYGASEIEENLITGITWEASNIQYTLMTTDTPLTEEELLEMAVEMMEN